MLKAIDELGIGGNTIVMFSSDNGPEEMEITNASHSAAGSPGPFRGRKRSLYDGGIRMPFICRWPNRTPSGTVDDESVIGAVDMMPTLCDAAGIAVPIEHNLEGENVLGALTGSIHTRAKPLFWEFACHPMYGHVINKSPVLAARRDRYKLLMNPERDRVELYDVSKARTELRDVASEHPEVVEELSTKLMAWKRGCPQNVRDYKAGSDAYRWPGSAPGTAGGTAPGSAG
jgi:N-acetylgalactosamine-6-sulfatase